MKIHNIEQRSEEWYEIKRLKMSASNAQAIMANGKGLESYCREIVRKHVANEEDRYTNDAMERGIELEAEARTIYEMETCSNVTEVGFVELDFNVGCSPDGLIDTDGLIEIKCPTNKVFFDYMLDGKIDTGYLAQMQMQMYVCDRSWCDYVVYNPNFPKSIIIKRVDRDEEMICKLETGLEEGRMKISEISNRLVEV